jgi:hypothetical protein
MDIFEATQALLTDAAPGANVTRIDLTYDEATETFLLPDYPAVTWLYGNLVPQVSHSGPTGLNTVLLDVEIWGSLEDCAKYVDLLTKAICGRRVRVGNVIFTVNIFESRDIVDLGLDCKHWFMRFSGMVGVYEVEGKDGREESL